ncbi:MAG: hypothetical protein KF836_06455 [Fimbriimonadaceae bacterium]|nr:hypothetical protein [Fimbriimonadaceae bacterium]
MPRFIIFAILTLGLAACKPPVTATKNIDGSQSVTVNTPDGSVTTTTKGDVSTYKDDKGNEMTHDASSGTTTIKTQDGEVNMQAGKSVAFEDFGLKAYPGATQDKNNQNTVESPQESVITSLSYTTDSPEKVVEFYRPMIVKDKSEANSNGNYMIGGQTSKKANVYISAAKNDGKTVITLTASIPKN